MDMATLKEEYKTRVVGFNNSGTPLCERSDLDVLVEIAVTSGDISLIEMFDELPTLEELNYAKGQQIIDEANK